MDVAALGSTEVLRGPDVDASASRERARQRRLLTVALALAASASWLWYRLLDGRPVGWGWPRLPDGLSQYAVSFGLTGGIHSLDDAEVEHWLDRVEVGNAYVNRHITGAVVQRQSFGGWKASVVGSGAKAGGPNYVAQLGRWADAPDVPSRTADPVGWLAWARADDDRAWLTEFSPAHDPSALGVEANVFRYRPVPGITVRVGTDAPDAEVQRVLAAAARAGVPATVVGQELTDEAFADAVADGKVTGRIRVVGEAPGLRDAAASRLGSVTVLDAPVLASGRRELLTMLREQSLSRTMHRYGHLRTS